MGMRHFPLLLSLLMLCTSAHACSCADMTGSERYARFPQVFVGKVVSTSLAPNPGRNASLGREVVHAMVVPSEVIKGTVQRPHRVTSGAEYLVTLCAVPMLAGAEYLFTLDESATVSRCNAWFADDPQSKELLRTFRRLKAQRR